MVAPNLDILYFAFVYTNPDNFICLIGVVKIFEFLKRTSLKGTLGPVVVPPKFVLFYLSSLSS